MATNTIARLCQPYGYFNHGTQDHKHIASPTKDKLKLDVKLVLRISGITKYGKTFHSLPIIN
jgi:hypothetical protein